MIAVIFEVVPSTDGRQAYLSAASALRDELMAMDGFISLERFESLAQPGKLLSLSFWRDEGAVTQWRQQDNHRRAQAAGRAGVFDDYRLRVAEVLRDYGLHQRTQAPTDSRMAHETGFDVAVDPIDNETRPSMGPPMDAAATHDMRAAPSAPTGPNRSWA